MSSFTCINCQIKFQDSESQREHYKTDWHRYNLKRRVEGLPPVTAQTFQNRVIELRVDEEKALQEQQLSNFCNACHKQFTNQKALENHLNSKKHKQNLRDFEKQNAADVTAEVVTKFKPTHREHPAIAVAAAGKGKFVLETDDTNSNDDDDYEDMDEEDEEVNSDELEQLDDNPLSERNCLFCVAISENMVENFKHMSLEHSFFIPDAEFCIDLEGLLNYLGEKVANYYMCLLCNERGKTFYSLDAVRKHMVDKGHCQMLHEGEALAEYANYYDYSSSYPDHVEGMDVDAEVQPEIIDGDEYQLVLPSGAIVGHRSLMRYYKQYLKPSRALVPKKNDRKLHRVLNEYRAMGMTRSEQQAVARRARDIKVLKRAQAKLQMQIGVKANKLQKHYRPQVDF